MKTVLVVDDVHESIFEPFQKLNWKVLYQPDATLSSIQSLIPNISGLIIRSKFKIDASFLEEAKNLQFIARAGAGLDLIDVQKAKELNIKVFAANEGNSAAVAEHVIGQLLILSAQLKKSDQEVRNHIWDREGNRGWELEGKTIGIIGYGNMGQALAKRLKPFGLNILAFDKYHPSTEYPATMEDIFMHADILSLHVPLTSETKNMIDAKFLNQFKKPIVLVNSARGEIMSLESMHYGIQKGIIQGLAIDVFPNEKLATWTERDFNLFEHIKSFPNTVFSPHVAGWTTESYQKISQVLADKIYALIQHELPQ